MNLLETRTILNNFAKIETVVIAANDNGTEHEFLTFNKDVDTYPLPRSYHGETYDGNVLDEMNEDYDLNELNSFIICDTVNHILKTFNNTLQTEKLLFEILSLFPERNEEINFDNIPQYLKS